ncbi:MAG: peptidylprolyl isomerase [Clostridia bacterium]|nr:peptidylprolyl isomerase [Clostridia bacterium]
MNIKKISLVLAVLFLFSAISVQAKTIEFTIGSDSMYISDSDIAKKTIDAKPYIENSRTMIPIRAVSENFGAEVSWNDAERKVTITADETIIELFIDSDIAKVNGEDKKLDTPPAIVDSRTMVPLRFISEALGKNVEYISASKQVLITDESPVMTINGERVTIDEFRAWATLLGYQLDPAYAEYIINDLSNTIMVTNLMAQEAEYNGYSLTEAQSLELTNSISSMSEDIYKSSLIAPIAKLLSDDLIITHYIDDLAAEEYPKTFVRAKHILILTTNMETGEKYDAAKLDEARQTVEDIKKKLDGGEDFDKLMTEYCEDPGIHTNPDGYVFTYGEMVPEFEETAFALKEGEISDIVETDYGYHIIKKEPLPEMDETIPGKIATVKLNEIYEECMVIGTIVQNMSFDELAEQLFGDLLIEMPQEK